MAEFKMNWSSPFSDELISCEKVWSVKNSKQRSYSSLSSSVTVWEHHALFTLEIAENPHGGELSKKQSGNKYEGHGQVEPKRNKQAEITGNTDKTERTDMAKTEGNSQSDRTEWTETRRERTGTTARQTSKAK